jgi:two-component system chemotaxis response regulator CheB
MDEFGPLLFEKVSAASAARLPSALRLTERVKLKLRSGGLAPRAPVKSSPAVLTAGSSPSSLGNVVIVGCSTGGPPALDALLAHLPRDFPWPIVIAQHMPASFTGPLARRLNKLCSLSVIEVDRPMELTPGQVYVGKGDADVVVAERAGRFIVDTVPLSTLHRWHPSVDRLVESAMLQLGARRIIGVLMTGMGNDGATTMTRLRIAGGRTIAEAEESAVVWGMPGELVKAGGAEVVAPLHTIADRLLEWAA